MPLLTVSIASWNTRDITHQCLQTLYANMGFDDFDVIVIDNASSDGSVEMIRREFPKVELMVNPVNVGFGRAHNMTIRARMGKSKYICIFNSDAFIHQDALKKLVEFLEAHPDADVATCKLLNTDGTIQESISFFPALSFEFLVRIPSLHRWIEAHPYDHDKFQQIDTFNGACYVVRMEAFERLGRAFDESLFAYMEETDMFWHMKQRGMKIFFLPESEVTHIGGASTKSWAQKHIWYYTNLLQFFLKEYGWPTLLLVRSVVTVSNVLSVIKWPVFALWPEGERKRFEMREMGLAWDLLKINLAGKIAL